MLYYEEIMSCIYLYMPQLCLYLSYSNIVKGIDKQLPLKNRLPVVIYSCFNTTIFHAPSNTAISN